jgi:23S rRNA pseudouridine2605 synthase
MDLKQHTSFMTTKRSSQNSNQDKPKLQKFLADVGLCSRRMGESWIKDEKVTVNGKVANLGMRVSPFDDTIKVNGKVVRSKVPASITLAVNKPKGYTCSNHDDFADRLIFELLPQRFNGSRLFCAGRLDLDSEGLVIITNDGGLAHRLTHPSQQIRKKYQIELKEPLSREHLPLMIQGIEDEGEFLRIDEIRSRAKSPIGETRLEVILGHGKKREIRRVFGHFRYQIRKLRRVSIGGLQLHKIPLGSFRELNPKEIDLLFPR